MGNLITITPVPVQQCHRLVMTMYGTIVGRKSRLRQCPRTANRLVHFDGTETWLCDAHAREVDGMSFVRFGA